MSLNPDYNRPRPRPLAPQQGLCDVFVKLGGSVLDHEPLTAALVPHLVALAGQQRIVILTGGGQAAKRIKANQRAWGTDFYQCWRAGVLCLEVTAHLLASYSTQLSLVASLSEAQACFAAGKVAVFAPAGAILHSFHLPPDWEATTDSIGLHFANALGAHRYVIVSDVDGIYARRPGARAADLPIPRMAVDELEQLPTCKLDPAFALYFRRYAIPTIVVNGSHPSRVGAAIRGEPTIGTEIAMPTWVHA